MKYIIVSDPEGPAIPVFCLAPMTHLEMAHAWRGRPARRVLSAGFVEFLPEGVRTFGFSTSLNLGPGPDDARLIAAFYKHTLATVIEQEARRALPACAVLGTADRPRPNHHPLSQVECRP